MSEPVLARVAAGDRDAVAACLDRYGNLVWSLARRFTASHADAEDAVQEVFIHLWENAGRFDPAKASETTFVAMIARRRLVDRLRRTKREPATEDLAEAAPTVEATVPEDLEVKQEAARALKLIGTLKTEQQQAICMAVYYGQSHSSIADAMGIPLGTVKTHLRRGLLRLREALRPSGPEPSGGEVVR